MMTDRQRTIRLARTIDQANLLRDFIRELARMENVLRTDITRIGLNNEAALQGISKTDLEHLVTRFRDIVQRWPTS